MITQCFSSYGVMYLLDRVCLGLLKNRKAKQVSFRFWVTVSENQMGSGESERNQLFFV